MQLPSRGDLLRRLPFALLRREEAGKGTYDDAPAISSKLILALALALSCIAHLAFLTPALIFGGRPLNAQPPDAVMVEIVPAAEVPQLGDRPVPAETQEPALVETPIKKTDASAAPPPAVATSPTQPRSVAPLAQAAPPPAPAPSSLPPSPLKAPPASQSAELDESNTANMFAMPLTMPDGTVGGRTFDQQAAEQADVTKDVAAAFFNHLKTCSTRPADVSPGARVVVRVYLNPDGTLAAGLPANPEPLKVSMGGGELFMNAIAALRKCQPYTMLPPDRYPEWRMLDLTFTPQNFLATP